MKYYLGKNIKELRKQSGMTQAQLAEKLEMSRQALSNWEKGSCEPDYLGILGLCKALNVDANRLLGVGEIFDQDKEYALTPTNQGKVSRDDTLVEVGQQDGFDGKNLPKKHTRKSAILLMVFVLMVVIVVGAIASLPFFNPLNSNVAYSVSFNLTTADKMKAVAIACTAVAAVACVWLVETAVENKKRKQEDKSNDRQI